MATMYLATLYKTPEDIKHDNHSVLSLSNMVEADGGTTIQYEVTDANFIVRTKHNSEYAHQIADKMTNGDVPVLAIDKDNNNVWLVCAVKYDDGYNINEQTVTMDKTSFPNGVSDILTMISL